MSGIITLKEVITEDALRWGGVYAENVQKAIDKNKELTDSALKLFDIQKQLKGVTTEKGLNKAQKEIYDSLIKANKAYGAQGKLLKSNQVIWKEQTQLENNLISTKKKNALATESTNRALIKERETLRQTNLDIKRNLTYMGRLQAMRDKARNSIQELNAKRALGANLSKKEQAELKKSTQAFKRYDNIIKKVRTSTGQFQENVGNYPKQLRAATGALTGFVRAFGVTTGILGFVQLMKSSIKVAQDFEKQSATLAGVLNLTKEEMIPLNDEARRLGSITVKTANEVSELQLAYARLGFSQQEIIDLTEATIQGSIALNAELGQTAELAGAMVNSFDDFGTGDAPEIMDILAKATANSALTFEKLQKGLPIVAGAANAAGVPFTKLVALQGKLADAGIDVSTSSTALRNIFIEAAAQGLNFSEILEKIKDSQNKLTEANDEFGKRAAVPAAVLANNLEAVEGLDQALQGAAGTAESMANKELDTLYGALQLLKSAWQGIILETDKTNSITTKLKETVKFLAANLDKMITFVAKATKAWLIYKAIMISISAITKTYTAVTVLLRIAKIALAGGLGKATAAMRIFNLAMASNPIGALVAVLVIAVSLIASFATGLDSAAKAQKRLNDAIQDGKDIAAKNKEATNEALQKEIALIKEKTRESVAGTKDEIAIRELSNQSIDKQIKAIEDEKEAIDKRIRSYKSQAKQFRKNSPPNKKYLTLVAEETKLTGELTKRIKSLTIDKKELNKQEIIAVNIKGKGGKKVKDTSIKDAFDLSKLRLKHQIDERDETVENDNITTYERLVALKERATKMKQLAELTKRNALIGVKKGSDQEKLILEQLTLDKIAIRKQTSEDTVKILNDEFNKIKAVQKEDKAKGNLALEQDLAERKALFAEDLSNTELSLDDRNAIIQKYEDDVVRIKREAANKLIEIQLEQLDIALLSTKLTTEQRANLEMQYSALKIAQSNNETDVILDNIQKQQEAEEKLQALKAQAIQQTSAVIADAFGLDAANLETFISGAIDGFDSTLEGIAAGFEVIADIGSSIAQGNIDELDRQIEASRVFYEEQYVLASGDDEQQKLIQAEQILREQELEKKKRKAVIKKAKFDKATAVLSIGINTAIAIAKSVAQFPITGGLPWSAIVAALGAVQIAAVLAKPLPKYEYGTEYHPGGPALVGEKRAEVIQEPGKAPYVIDRPTVLNLATGAKVTSSIEEYDDLKRASIMSSFDIQGKNLNNYDAMKIIEANMMVANEMRLTRKAIEDKQLNVYNNNQQSSNYSEEMFKFKNTNWE